MISALVGSVIMTAVTVAMLLAVNITDKSLINAGKYPLTNKEKKILIDAGYKLVDIESINQEIKSLEFNQ